MYSEQNKMKLLFTALMFAWPCRKFYPFQIFPLKRNTRMCKIKKERRKQESRKMGEKRNGILVNLKRNLDSMSSCLQVCTCWNGKAWRSNLFVPGVEKMIRNEYSFNGHKRYVLRMSDVWSISCSAKRDKRVSTQK